MSAAVYVVEMEMKPGQWKPVHLSFSPSTANNDCFCRNDRWKRPCRVREYVATDKILLTCNGTTTAEASSSEAT
jgi:hypothetical protein